MQTGCWQKTMKNAYEAYVGGNRIQEIDMYWNLTLIDLKKKLLIGASFTNQMIVFDELQNSLDEHFKDVLFGSSVPCSFLVVFNKWINSDTHVGSFITLKPIETNQDFKTHLVSACMKKLEDISLFQKVLNEIHDGDCIIHVLK